MAAAPRARIVVHLVDLDLRCDGVEGWSGLAPGDLHRGVAIASPTERARFLAGRQVLRTVLGQRLGCAPEDVPIRVTSQGKPFLATGRPAFSLARRDRWCAIALSEDCAVGVDVEPIRTIVGLDAMVAQFFPPDAQSEWEGTAPDERIIAFFRWWTRLEAAVKACGENLDAGSACLSVAPQRLCYAIPSLALAVAAVTDAPLTVEWHLAAGPLAFQGEKR
jgi:4'-phosphopantetheinyl transferase